MKPKRETPKLAHKRSRAFSCGESRSIRHSAERRPSGTTGAHGSSDREVPPYLRKRDTEPSPYTDKRDKSGAPDGVRKGWERA